MVFIKCLAWFSTNGQLAIRQIEKLRPRVLVVKSLPASSRDIRDMSRSLGREDPLEGEMAICSIFLSGKFHGRGSLMGYSPWGGKEWDTTEHTRTPTTREGSGCLLNWMTGAKQTTCERELLTPMGRINDRNATNCRHLQRP